ncbi:hypothetical protein RND81_04G013900 [Saponaria officinalis]|uniref:Uncharacterized protein n=1 Tax=Saponaria officinalis TaxID=3572 RepID=A0AAW1LHU4_SAPOF
MRKPSLLRTSCSSFSLLMYSYDQKTMNCSIGAASFRAPSCYFLRALSTISFISFFIDHHKSIFLSLVALVQVFLDLLLLAASECKRECKRPLNELKTGMPSWDDADISLPVKGAFDDEEAVAQSTFKKEAKKAVQAVVDAAPLPSIRC